MRSFKTWRAAFALAVLALAGAMALAAPGGKGGKSKGDVDGENDHPNKAKWVWKLFNAKGKEADRGTFVGHRSGEIFHAKKKIGSFKVPGKGQVKATFTEGKLSGKVEMRLTKAKPRTYEGELERKGGDKVKLVVELIED